MATGTATATAKRTRNENRGEYPHNWARISYRVKRVHRFRCERCGHPHVPAQPKNGILDLWNNDFGLEQLAMFPSEWVTGRGRRSVGMARPAYERDTLCDSLCEHDPPFTNLLHKGKPRVLTVHHLDGDKSNCALWNLAALCQVCHLEVQAKVAWEQTYFLPHSPWMTWHIKRYRRWCHKRGITPVH